MNSRHQVHPLILLPVRVGKFQLVPLAPTGPHVEVLKYRTLHSLWVL